MGDRNSEIAAGPGRGSGDRLASAVALFSPVILLLVVRSLVVVPASPAMSAPRRPVSVPLAYPLGTFGPDSSDNTLAISRWVLAQDPQDTAGAVVVLTTNDDPRIVANYEGICTRYGVRLLHTTPAHLNDLPSPSAVTLPATPALTDCVLVYRNDGALIWRSTEAWHESTLREAASVVATLQATTIQPAVRQPPASSQLIPNPSVSVKSDDGQSARARTPIARDVGLNLAHLPGRVRSLFEPTVRGPLRAASFVEDVRRRRAAVLLVFWATWCEACLQEASDLHALHAEFPNVVFVGLLDQEWSSAYEKRAREITTPSERSHQYFLDDSAIQKALWPKLDPLSLPAFAIFDSSQHLRLTMTGTIKVPENRDRLRRTLQDMVVPDHSEAR